MATNNYQIHSKAFSISMIIIIIIIILLALGVISCTKEPLEPTITGNYKGVIVYNLITNKDTISCQRNFNSNLVKWYNTPEYWATITNITSNSYDINTVIITDTVWCYNTRAIRSYIYNGKGTIINNVLTEEGSVIYLVKTHSATYCEIGNWSAKMIRE